MQSTMKPHRPRARTALALLLVTAFAGAPLFADKGVDRVQRRAERLERSFEEQQLQEEVKSTPWSAGKVAINIDLRVPAGDALAFFAATGADAAQLRELTAELTPIMNEVSSLARGGPYRGENLPRTFRTDTAGLRTRTFAAVRSVFGPEREREFRDYLERKYAAIRDLNDLRGSDRFFIVGDLPY